MAREVIADLDFNETQAAAALKNVEAQLARLEGRSTVAARSMTREWDRTANAFTARMFSMRTVAATLFGGATLAGGVLALKNLYLDAARGDENFKRLTASMTVMHDTLVKIIQEAPQFKAFMAGIADLPLIVGAAAKAAEPQGLAKQILGSLPFGQLLVFKLELDRLRRQRDELMKPSAGAAVTPTPFSFTGFPLKPVGAAGMGDLNFEAISGSLARFSPFADAASAASQRLKDSIMGVRAAMFDVNEQFRVGPSAIHETVTAFKDVNDVITGSQIAFEGMAIAMQGAGAMLAQLISEGGNGKEMFKGVMQGLSAAMFAKAAEYAAYAIAATTGIGMASLAGTPAQFWKASGLFAGVGVLAGSASRGLSGGGRSGGGGSLRGASAALPPASGRPSQTISIVFEGDVFVDREERVDELIDAIQERLSDGKNGGDFH